MGHFLHFGAGPNQLPEPWQNLGGDHDIRKPLRFGSGSASGIFAEHVLEHVPFLAGMGFLGECWRVLDAGGVVRLAIPDAARFVREFDHQSWRFNWSSREYADGLSIRGSLGSREAVTQLLTGYGHQSAWTVATLAAALLACGFEEVYRCNYGSTPRPTGLSGIDGHHKAVGLQVATLETSILEARK